MLADNLTLVDSSVSASPVNINLVVVASPSLPNNTRLRRQSPFSISDNYEFLTTWVTSSKTGIVSANYQTKRTVTGGGISEYATLTTRLTYPQSAIALTPAHVYSLISAHTSFVEVAGGITATDNVARLFMAGEL